MSAAGGTALVALAACLILGIFARHAPIGLDAAAARFAFGRATRLAWIFTRLGYARDLAVVLAVAGVLTLALLPGRIDAFALLVAAQVLSQLAVDALKSIYRRARPERWLMRKESKSSYPSGHACTAVVVFAGLSLGLLHAPLGSAFARDALAVAGFAVAGGIAWSRLALGAHYLSDVAGGLLFGTATVVLVASIAGT